MHHLCLHRGVQRENISHELALLIVISVCVSWQKAPEEDDLIGKQLRSAYHENIPQSTKKINTKTSSSD